MGFGKKLSDFQKSELLRKFHMAAWVFGGLLCTYWLLRCCAGVSSAWDDFKKFRDLGFSYTFQYHLQRECVDRDAIVFALTGAQWLHYVLQYRRAEQRKKSTGAAWVFCLLLAVHIAMWLYGKTLPYPQAHPFEEAVMAAVYFRRVADRSVLPPLMYCVSYLLRIQHEKGRQNNSHCPEGDLP